MIIIFEIGLTINNHDYKDNSNYIKNNNDYKDNNQNNNDDNK